MKLSELIGKEIVNMFDGARLGTIGESDLMINSSSGEIVSIILPGKGKLINFWSEKLPLVIPWDAVKKIGSEVIIVELNPLSGRNRM